MELRTCKDCNEEKQLTEFHQITRKDYTYILLRCKKCENLKRNLKKNYKRKNDLREYISRSLVNAKQRAKSKELEFNLTREWYIANLPEKCPVFNTLLDFTSNVDEHKPSIDRIDSAKGYTTDNCVIISWKANNIKNKWSLEDLKAVVNYLENNT